jgi:hypothetical protein
MGQDRPGAIPGAYPAGHFDVPEPDGGNSTAAKLGEDSEPDQGTVGDPDRGEIEDCAQVERQAGATRMIQSGGIDHDDVGPIRQ